MQKKSSISHLVMAMLRVRWTGHGQKKGVERGEKENKGKKGKKDQRCMESKGKGKFHGLWTWMFIAEGNDVSRVLIHLPSLIFRRHGSWLGGRSITMISMSCSECALLLNCSATGDASVLLCTIDGR